MDVSDNRGMVWSLGVCSDAFILCRQIHRSSISDDVEIRIAIDLVMLSFWMSGLISGARSICEMVTGILSFRLSGVFCGLDSCWWGFCGPG